MPVPQQTEGNKEFQSGNFQKAVDLFAEAIKADADNHILYSNRSAAYAKLGEFEKALEDAERVVSLKSDWAKGYSRKGAALHGLGRLDEAAAAYRTGLEHDPSNVNLNADLRNVEAALASQSNPLGGMEQFAAKLQDPAAYKKLLSNPKLAPLLADPSFMAKLNEIRADPSKLMQHMRDPNILTVILSLMGIDSSFGDEMPSPASDSPAAPKSEPAKESKVFEESDKELSEEQQKRQDSDKEKELGNACYKQKDFENALTHYDRAWELDGSNVAVLNNKAAVLFEQERYEECIQECQKAVDVGRELRADFKLIARALGRIGNAFAKLDNIEEAIKYLQKSLTEHRTAPILEKLHELERLQKERAKEAYRDPKLAEEARERGNVLFREGNYTEAMKHYNDALKRNDADPKSYSNRAACFTKLMAFPEAEKDCDKAIELDPTFIKAFIRKAAILFLKKDYMKCIDLCNEAKAKDTEQKHTAELDNQIARCYQQLNQIQNSGNEEEIMKNAMKNPEVQQIMSDPVMMQILKQMQTDPGAIKEHMNNPQVAQKIRTLINAGILRVA